MPVTFERLESNIYAVELSGEVMLDALVEAQQKGLEEAQRHDEPHYVLVVKVDRDTRMPFDLRHAGQLIKNDRSLAVVSVGATLHMKFIVSILARVFGLGRVEHAKSYDDAIRRARQILATNA